jgi:N-methylhydantoinase A
MGYTVDIDTGGTFTDGLFTNGKEIRRAKVDTTPHDLTVSWIKCIQEGAQKFGFKDLRDFLEEVDIVRWSNTTATNIIAERKGPKLGLFVTGGYEKTLYSAFSESPVLGHLIEESNVQGMAVPLDPNVLVIQLKELLEQGVRRICISLKDGLRYLKEEIRIKEIFEEQYPDHYLGNVPFLLAGDICKHPDDMTRTHMALLNSYVHGPMAQTMFKAEDELREYGFSKPLLLGHTNGGVARVAKTKPVDTIESGPIFGIHAGAYWANLYQLKNVITLDVGGTTTKIGLVTDFRPAITREAGILGVPLSQPMLDLRSIALGGGAVARATNGGIQLGPESMGAYPGPACYDIGGTEATLTDAYLLQGFLNPEYFAGGTKKIHVMRAEKIIQEKLGKPLGINAHVAAYEISSRATMMIADEVAELIKRTGVSPHNYTLFAFGGNGSIVGCEVAKKAGIEKVYFFSLGSVLSAFGSSVADVSHTYEYSPFVPVSEIKKLADIIRRLMEDARRDMEGEGFDLGKVEAELEFSIYSKKDPHNPIESTCPWIVDNLEDQRLIEMISDCMKEAQVGPSTADMVVEILRLRARAVIPKMEPLEYKEAGKDPRAALKGERIISRGKEQVPTSIYEWDEIQPGNVISAAAIIEGSDTTYVVPRGWELVMDSFRNGLLIRR